VVAVAEGVVVADATVVADAAVLADVVTAKLGVGVVAGATELAATDGELGAGVLALDTLLLAAHPASNRHEATYKGLARRDISQRLAGVDHVTTPNVEHFAQRDCSEGEPYVHAHCPIIPESAGTVRMTDCGGLIFRLTAVGCAARCCGRGTRR
jgi:hypothetical protein